jgi:NADH-quinone oxidoreductase subunit M
MNELGFPILSLMLAIPIVAGAACLFVGAHAARWLALAATLADLLLGILLWNAYEVGGAQWQFVEYSEISAASPGRSASTASP